MSQVGMMAGAGELPEIIARRAYAEGSPVPTVALSAHVAAQLTPYCPTLVQYGPGQLTKIIRAFQRYKVQQVVMVGKVEKRLLFENPRLDLRGLRRLSRMRDYRDVQMWDVIYPKFLFRKNEARVLEVGSAPGYHERLARVDLPAFGVERHSAPAPQRIDGHDASHRMAVAGFGRAV